MKRAWLLVFWCLPVIFSGYGQHQGINFREGSWKEILREARKEKKPVFVDCYTSWCGPCKMLAKEVFTQDSVADFFNRHFVCVKQDMEKEGKPLRQQYQVASYPTLLFIDPRTEERVHALVGYVKADVLLRNGRNALDSRNSLAGLAERYRKGERGTGFMYDYLSALKAASRNKENEKILEDYARTLTDEQFVSVGIWKILDAQLDARSNPLSYVFQRFVALREGFYQVADPKMVDFKLGMVIQNYMAQYVRWDASKKVAFDSAGCHALMDYLQTVKYSPVADWLAQLYTALYLGRQDYRGMIESMKEAMKFNFMDASTESYYLILFLNPFCQCHDMELVKEVYNWLDGWLEKHPEEKLLEGIKERLGRKLKEEAPAN